MFNLASGLTFLVGALLAYALSGAVDIAILLPFAAGNLIYVGGATCCPRCDRTACGDQLLLQVPPRSSSGSGCWEASP